MFITSGNELKEWRKANHLSQDELAKMLGYSKSTIAHIESPKSNAKISTRLQHELNRLNSELHPLDEGVIDTWRNLCKYTLPELREPISRIATYLPDLLTIKDVGTHHNCEAYLRFFAASLRQLTYVKHGNFTSKEKFDEKFKPIIGVILKEARLYLCEKEEANI